MFVKYAIESKYKNIFDAVPLYLTDLGSCQSLIESEWKILV